MITPRTTRQVATGPFAVVLQALPCAASIGLLAVALAACSQGDLRGPELSSELEPALDTTTVWTDTTIIYVDHPGLDSLYFLMGRRATPLTKREALRASIEMHRQEIHDLETDPQVRANIANPDSFAAELRVALAEMEAELARPEWTPAWADSIQCMFRGHLESLRESGLATAQINGYDVTLEELIEVDSVLSNHRVVATPLRCP